MIGRQSNLQNLIKRAITSNFYYVWDYIYIGRLNKKSVAMKVEKVSFNAFYNKPQGVGTAKRQALPYNPKFTGAVAVSQKELVKELKNIVPYSMKVISKLAESMGEVQNIVINSLGTGLVAPLFIKYNPLSKTDEDTRTYSAWRQPISAALAVVTQAGMVAPFNSIISDMAYSGYYPEEYNLSNFKDEKYIKKMLKKAEPGLTKEQLAKRVSEELENQHKELLNNIRLKNRIMLTSSNAPSQALSETAYHSTLLDTIKSLIKTDTDKQKSCNVKAEKRLYRSEFLSKNAPEVQTVLEEIKGELDKADNLSTMKTYLKSKISQLKKQKADKELISMVKEILDRNKKVSAPPKVDGKPPIDPKAIIMEELRDKTDKMLEHVKKYADIKDKGAIQAEVAKSVAERKEAFEKSLSLLEDIKGRLEKGEKLSVSKIEKMLKKHAKGISFKDSALHTDFAEEMITKYKNNIENNLKGHKQFTGLIISLAVLPITCCLLNWVYPRFMDAVFPNLSNKKHDNEAKELVDKAPKKAGGAA